MNPSRSYLRTRTLVSSHRPRTERQETTLDNYVRYLSKLAAQQMDPSVPQIFTLEPRGEDPCIGHLETDRATVTIEFSLSFTELTLPITADMVTRIVKRDRYSLPIGCAPNDTTFLPVAIYYRLTAYVERIRCLPESHPYWQKHSSVRLHQHLGRWGPGWCLLVIDDPAQPNRSAAFAVPPAAWKNSDSKCFWWITNGTDRDGPFPGAVDNHPTADPEHFLKEVK